MQISLSDSECPTLVMAPQGSFLVIQHVVFRMSHDNLLLGAFLAILLGRTSTRSLERSPQMEAFEMKGTRRRFQ